MANAPATSRSGPIVTTLALWMMRSAVPSSESVVDVVVGPAVVVELASVAGSEVEVGVVVVDVEVVVVSEQAATINTTTMRAAGIRTSGG